MNLPPSAHYAPKAYTIYRYISEYLSPQINLKDTPHSGSLSYKRAGYAQQRSAI